MASLKSCPGKRQYWTCDFTPELWRGCCSFNPCQGYFEQCRDEIKDLLVNDEGAWDPASGKLGWDGNKFVSDTTTRTNIRSPTTTLTSISVRTTVVAETSDVGPKITKTITATNGNAVETSTGNSPTALAEDTKSSAGVGVGAIVGAAVGGAFITLLAVGLVIFLLRRRRRKADSLAARDGYHPPMDQYGEQEKGKFKIAQADRFLLLRKFRDLRNPSTNSSQVQQRRGYQRLPRVRC